ncbi:MAG: hypothetical protein ABIO04_04735 [Ferruginibacter sp.]
MKFLILILAIIINIQTGFSQLKATKICPPVSVDVLAGKVNSLYPKSTSGEIQKDLPCFTEVIEADSAKCAGVFYADQGLYFYPGRNYFEVRENFKGKITLPLGTARSSLFSILGNPKIKDLTWDAYQTEYGTLVLYYNKDGKINKMQISSKSTDALKLCE